MRVLILDPFHDGSHAAVTEGYRRYSAHTVTTHTLEIAGGWRWRMRGAAVTFARQVRAFAKGRPLREQFDLLLTTDMLDLATFLGLTRDLVADLPVALYFHENQLTYPLPAGRSRDLTFPWINYTSALAADAVLFNSQFHQQALLDALPTLPARYHDHRELDLIAQIAAKSSVLYPGLDLARLDVVASPIAPAGPPIILWNSRWEYDKQPELLFAALEELNRRGIAFRLILVGKPIDAQDPIFAAARLRFADQILHWGYAPSAEAYAALLWQADLVVSTAAQEFFGIALLEAMYCGCVPVVPRRLSYPELIPAEHHAACFYDRDSDLADRLTQSLRDLPALRQRDWRAIAARHDWRVVAATYDARFVAIRAAEPHPTV